MSNALYYQILIQQQKDFNGPWNSFIWDLKNMISLWSPKMNLSKVFKDFRNYFSLCQVFDELLEWFSRKYQWLLHYSLRVLDCYWEIPTDAGKAKSRGCQILWGRKRALLCEMHLIWNGYERVKKECIASLTIKLFRFCFCSS